MDSLPSRSAALPAAATRPFVSKIPRCAIESAISAFCSISKIVVPLRFTPATVSKYSSISLGESPSTYYPK